MPIVIFLICCGSITERISSIPALPAYLYREKLSTAYVTASIFTISAIHSSFTLPELGVGLRRASAVLAGKWVSIRNFSVSTDDSVDSSLLILRKLVLKWFFEYSVWISLILYGLVTFCPCLFFGSPHRCLIISKRVPVALPSGVKLVPTWKRKHKKIQMFETRPAVLAFRAPYRRY